jgi:two-component system nitrate/nitrite sensor histidine kinase NarQ
VIVKRSVTRSIAQALSAIVLLSLLTTGLALVTLFSSQRDAEAINLAANAELPYGLGCQPSAAAAG